MRVTLDDQAVMHICPESSTEVMALRYWLKELQTHGVKMISICDSAEEGNRIYEAHNPHNNK